MSDYRGAATVSRLVEEPRPATLRLRRAGGQLTEAVLVAPWSSCSTRSRRRTPKVFDRPLQVFDDGRLTDGQGRTVDFRNTVLIMTSNIRSAEQMREHFRPVAS